VWAREGGALGPVGNIRGVLSVGRGGRTLRQPTKHVRTHTHKLKPLNHFTLVPQPLCPLRLNIADPAGALDNQSGGGEVLLFSNHNRRIVASLGLDKLSLVAFGVVVDTGAGPNLVRRNALAPDWFRQVVSSKKEEQVRLRDANNARLRASGTVTLWLQTGARIVSVPFLVVDDLSVPVILGCTFIDDNASAILPQDRSIRWTDGSVTEILRGPLDDGDRSMGVSRVLRSTHKKRIPPLAATVVWVRTMWGGLGQVFGATRLFTSHAVDILPGLSFPVIVTNFGAREVVLRQRANVGYVELLTTGVVLVPHGAPQETLPDPVFTTATAAKGEVGAVSGTLCDPAPGRSPDMTAPTDGGPATPARPRKPGGRGALPAARPPGPPSQVEDVEQPDCSTTGPPMRQGATAGTSATAGDVGPRRVVATPAAVVADGLATRDGGARGRPRCPARAT